MPRHLAGDVTGGSLAGLMSLPAAMAYGVLIFGAFGPDMTSLGVVSGLIALALINLVSAPFAGSDILSSSPGALPTLMLASAVPGFISTGAEGSAGGNALVLIFLAVFLAGLFQVLLGSFRLGELAKYVPYPVTAGLLTGTGILIFKSQISPFLGLPQGSFALADVRWWGVGVGVITSFTVVFGAKIARKVPAPVLGVVVGTTAYYVIQAVAGSSGLGPTIGAIPTSVPTPKYLSGFFTAFADGSILPHLPSVISLALGLGVVASLDTLVACIAGDSVSSARSNTSRELVAQGAGNIACSLFGGIIGVGSASRSVASYNFGARTRLSRVTTGLFALIVLLVIAPAVAKVPVVVLASLLVVLSIGLVDRWSLSTLSDLVRKKEPDPRVAISNLVIMFAVVGLMIVAGIVEAVGVGVVFSLVYFVVRMGKQIVRHRYNGATWHSNTHRPPEEFAVLEREGLRIQILELEGSLFFGTADKVLSVIEEACASPIRVLVLDLTSVAELDLTGIRLLEAGARVCDRAGADLVMCVPPASPLVHVLAKRDGTGSLQKRPIFADINEALNWAENVVLDESLDPNLRAAEMALGDFSLFEDLSPEDLASVARSLDVRRVTEGETIFNQGEQADRLYLIAKGQVRIVAEVPGIDAHRLLATLRPGTLVGELAVVDQRPRSASAIALGEVVLYELTTARLNEIRDVDPHLWSSLLQGISRHIVTSLRISNRRIR